MKKVIIHIDNSLEKYKTMPVFQEKVDKANEVLRTVDLPASTTLSNHTSTSLNNTSTTLSASPNNLVTNNFKKNKQINNTYLIFIL